MAGEVARHQHGRHPLDAVHALDQRADGQLWQEVGVGVQVGHEHDADAQVERYGDLAHDQALAQAHTMQADNRLMRYSDGAALP